MTYNAFVILGYLVVEGLIVFGILWGLGKWYEDSEKEKKEARMKEANKLAEALMAAGCTMPEPGSCPEYDEIQKVA